MSKDLLAGLPDRVSIYEVSPRDGLQNESLTERARGFAAVALGIVADKELLPWNSKISVDLNYRAAVSSLSDGGSGIVEIL